MRDALFFIARGVEADGDGVVRDCELLHAAMAGMGTKDERMCVCLSFLLRVSADLVDRIYRLVRNHWNRPRFNAIKNQYQVLYRNSLRRAVEGETTGKYEKALVGIIEQN